MPPSRRPLASTPREGVRNFVKSPSRHWQRDALTMRKDPAEEIRRVGSEEETGRTCGAHVLRSKSSHAPIASAGSSIANVTSK